MSTILDLTNTSSWPDEDLIALYWACLAEQERRRRLIDLPAQVEQMTRQYLDARDGTQPSESSETLADTSAWPAFRAAAHAWEQVAAQATAAVGVAQVVYAAFKAAGLLGSEPGRHEAVEGGVG